MTSFMGFAMRRYPGSSLLGITPLDDIQVQQRFMAYMLDLQGLMPGQQWKHMRNEIAAYRPGQVKEYRRLLGAIKSSIAMKAKSEAEDYLVLRLQNRPWAHFVKNEWLQASFRLHQKRSGDHSRLAYLRWVIAADIDDYTRLA